MADMDDEPLIDWEARFQQVKRECFELFGFVYSGEQSGEITKETAKAYFRKSVEIQSRAGILYGTTDDSLDLTALWAVLRQKNHECCKAMLAIQPELRESLEKAVPSMRGRTR